MLHEWGLTRRSSRPAPAGRVWPLQVSFAHCPSAASHVLPPRSAQLHVRRQNPMHISVRVKFWFFEHYWWLLCIAVALALGVLLWREEPIPTVATVLGAILSVAYFLQKQKLEELRVFREIFRECNARYDALNDHLAKIMSKGDQPLSEDERLKVIDYLNLCGEEYLYFKRGYIEPSVWQAWSNGMRIIIAAPAIARTWQQEKQSASYYKLPL